MFHREPCSPKVTCIGQVRGKSRKHGEKMKMLACRSHPPRNQRWVHLPFKDFTCFIPCKSSCFTTTTTSNNSNSNSNDKGGSSSSSSSCGGVFRWMVSLHDGESGVRRDVELVVNGDNDEDNDEDGDEDVRVMERDCSRRRSIFDDMEFDDLFNDVGITSHDNDNDNDGSSRVSICVPPKNALLLMRCRSDPIKMASLSQKHHHRDELIEEENHNVKFERLEVSREDGVVGIINKEEESIGGVELEEEIGEICEVVGLILEDLGVSSRQLEKRLEEGEDMENRRKTEENRKEFEEEEKSVKEEGDLQNVESKDRLNLVDGKFEECGDGQEHQEIEGQERGENSSTLQESTKVESKQGKKVQEKGEARKSTEKENNKPMLPDCLLLMMCEPKLSMEVSKETWVCGTDFIRRHHGNNKAGDNDNYSNKKTKAAAVAALPPLPPSAQGIHPGRSSISFPASGGSVASLIEQKLANAGAGFEPLVLTRCKSAPIRSTAKFEPHRPATCGLGMAGV